MKLLAVLFVILSAISAEAYNLDDANSYVDEVLSIYVPWAIEHDNLEKHDMTNFVKKYKTQSRDDKELQVQVFFHSGNVTGMQNVVRKNCKEPKVTSDSITLDCVLDFPELLIAFEARFQELEVIPNGIRFRQFDFNVSGSITNMLAEVKVITSHEQRRPTIKDLTMVDGGMPSFRFGGHYEDVSYETLSTYFFQKFEEVFQDAFYGVYREALERAFGSIPISPDFPFS